MKFELRLASSDSRTTVDVVSIDDLKEISERFNGERLIIQFRSVLGDPPRITVYDDYVE